MKSNLKNKKSIFLFSSLILSLIAITIFKTSSISYEKEKYKIRNLMTEEIVEERCKKTEKEFTEIYTEEKEFEKIKNMTELNKYQTALKELIDKKDWKKIKDYIPRIIIFIIIILLDIIFFFVWLFSAFCCCFGKKHKENLSCCSKCLFFIYAILSIIIIIGSAYGILSFQSLYKSFNGISCSLYKLIFHFMDGTKNDYQYLNVNWKGLYGIEELIYEFDNVKKTFDKLPKYSEIKNDCNQNNQEICEVYKYLTENIIEDNTDFIVELGKTKEKISDISEVFKNIQNETLDDIENIYIKVDDYYKLFFCLIFFLFLGLCFLELFILILYFICNCDSFICFFHFFWNLLMITVICSIFIGSIFSLIAILFKDSVALLNYAKSSENIKSEEPFLFKDINKNEIEKLNICFNGNGDLMSVFNLSLEFGKDFNEQYKQYEEAVKSIQKNKEQIDKELIIVFEKLGNGMNQMKILFEELNSNNLYKIFNCKFVGLDFDILFKELKDNFSKKLLVISILIIILGILSILSAEIGVNLIKNYTGYKNNNYKEPKEKYTGRVQIPKNNMDVSSENLRH